MVRVGEQRFPHRGRHCLRTRPHVGSMNIGLRLMMSREAFERTGLMQLGSRACAAVSVQAGSGRAAGGTSAPRDPARAAGSDGRGFPRNRIRSSPTGSTRRPRFLSLVSLIALIVGAIGVAMAMHAHLQQKMDHIAVMKSLGATSSEIIRIYTLQTLMLGLVGGLAGVAVGRGVEQMFPLLIHKYFSLDASRSGWHIAAAAQGIAVGMLTTLLFTVPPLLAIRKIRPALILRRDMPEAKLPLAQARAWTRARRWPRAE